MSEIVNLPTNSPTTNPTISRLRKERHQSIRHGVVGVLVAGLVTLVALPLSAQAPPENRDAESRVQVATRSNVPAPRIVVKAKDTIEHTYVRPRVAMGRLGDEADKAITPATLIVTYTDFPPAAETAFQAAVDIWSQLISSPVPIQVDAVWKPLGSTTLGSAGPMWVWRDFTGAVPGTWFPDALADALFGSNLGGVDPDIVASFNSDRTDWYMGTDGNPPPGEYDLVTVVLHEIAHGLGFLGSMNVNDGADPAVCGAVLGNGCWGPDFPDIYDRFTQDVSGRFLIDPAYYTNPSAALGTTLTGSNVFFSGTNANLANGGTRPELYAPSSWNLGSSYAHLDEDVYPAGNANSLMTYALGSAEAIHDPGPISLGIFEDIGWETAGTIFTDGFESGNVSAWSSSTP